MPQPRPSPLQMLPIGRARGRDLELHDIGFEVPRQSRQFFASPRRFLRCLRRVFGESVA